MNSKITTQILAILLSIVLFQCSNNTIPNTLKFHLDDPFKNTIAPSQLFDIDSKIDNVIEGENGTVVVCPKGCFLNSKGEIVETSVKIELSEALSLEDMLLSNLTTTSNGKLLETGGMIYFNATTNGEQLTINKKIPIHIEIPTNDKKAGMMAYKGIRDEKGNMNWIEQKGLDSFLVTIDLDELDFLPPGFQTAVDKGMPYKKYKTATKKLTDSLYYSLSISNGSQVLNGFVATNYNEPYYNKHKKVVNGGYNNTSYIVGDAYDTTSVVKTVEITIPGIDPASIQVIKSKKYQNTLIATREFETRLKTIFKACENDSILEIYIKNLDKNLYELDEMAAQFCAEKGYSEWKIIFENFAKQRLTKVKQADKYAALLKGYYEKQLAKVKKELEQKQEKLLKILDKKNEEAQELADDYKKLLWKREKYRMEAYGFDWSETGWVNVDRGTIPKDWGAQPLEITVTNGKQFDRVYTYVIYTSIKSLYRLNTTNNELFYVGNDQDKTMLMPEKKLGVAIAIGYKDEVPSLAVKEFETGSEPIFSLTLSPSTLAKVKDAISPYEKYAKENKISKDLEFMAKFYEEAQRQKELQKEAAFLMQLWDIAYSSCAGLDSTSVNIAVPSGN